MRATKTKKENVYLEAVGRRKTSVARVRLVAQSEGITVNGRPYKEYFPTLEMQKIAEDAFRKTRPETRFGVSAKIKGGGIHSQSEALRHGISRALLEFDPEFRKKLKKAGFLKRDPRMKERRKFGLKKARRAPQWAKR
ncbi:MAG: 30S ribosomal protein S9 [Candidatus Ryanbacteria bacterium]|nr:30S ribosomal protein S9 [Candidatus Ryanbacteria bacterium]